MRHDVVAASDAEEVVAGSIDPRKKDDLSLSPWRDRTAASAAVLSDDLGVVYDQVIPQLLGVLRRGFTRFGTR